MVNLLTPQWFTEGLEEFKDAITEVDTDVYQVEGHSEKYDLEMAIRIARIDKHELMLELARSVRENRCIPEEGF